jgi:hypothetical protein
MKSRPAIKHLRFAGRLLVCCLLIIAMMSPFLFQPGKAQADRFFNRSLTISNTNPGATAKYTFSWQYPRVVSIGSIRLLLCTDPFFEDPCDPAPGDFSNAVLTSQSGETGFSILNQSQNEIILTRTPSATATIQSTYVFDNIKNPTGLPATFYVGY